MLLPGQVLFVASRDKVLILLTIFFQARELVIQSDGIEQTRALAEDYANKAAAALDAFPDSEAKEGLIQMTRDVLKRKK